MKNFYVTCVLLLLPMLASGQVMDITLLKAKVCIDQNRTDSAFHLLNSSESSLEKALLMGNCFFRIKSYRQASQWYLIADSMAQGSSSFELAKAYARMNNAAKATFWLRKYLVKAGKKSELEIRKDSSFLSLSSTPEWKQVWQNEWYSSSEIEKNMVLSMISKGKTTEAMNELDENKSKFSPRHEYFYLKARIYNKLQQPELAIAAIEKAVTFYSFSDTYYTEYASILQKNKKHNVALECMNKAIQINSYNPEYYLKRGEIARLAGKYDLAERDLMLYKALYPDNAETYYQLGHLEAERGNKQTAMDYYDMLLTKDKSHALYFVERGNLALSLNQVQKADEDFSLALDLNPNIQEAYLNKGKTLQILNDSEGACFYWIKAREFGSAEAAKLIQANCKEQ